MTISCLNNNFKFICFIGLIYLDYISYKEIKAEEEEQKNININILDDLYNKNREENILGKDDVNNINEINTEKVNQIKSINEIKNDNKKYKRKRNYLTMVKEEESGIKKNNINYPKDLNKRKKK